MFSNKHVKFSNVEAKHSSSSCPNDDLTLQKQKRT